MKVEKKESSPCVLELSAKAEADELIAAAQRDADALRSEASAALDEARQQAEAAMRNHHLRDAIEVEDTAEIYLRKGNVPALLYASTAYSQDAPVILEMHFEGAVVRLEGDVMTVIREGQRQEIPCVTDPVLGRSYWGAGHKACIADFYRSIETGEPYRNDPASCDAVMRTLFSLYAQ